MKTLEDLCPYNEICSPEYGSNEICRKDYESCRFYRWFLAIRELPKSLFKELENIEKPK